MLIGASGHHGHHRENDGVLSASSRCDDSFVMTTVVIHVLSNLTQSSKIIPMTESLSAWIFSSLLMIVVPIVHQNTSDILHTYQYRKSYCGDKTISTMGFPILVRRHRGFPGGLLAFDRLFMLDMSLVVSVYGSVNLTTARYFAAEGRGNVQNLEQGKSEGFDSYDRPSNLTEIGLNLSIFQPTWPWTDGWPKKNNTAPFLCYFKLFAPFHSHWWIQTGVTVQKCPIWVKFDDF